MYFIFELLLISLPPKPTTFSEKLKIGKINLFLNLPKYLFSLFLIKRSVFLFHLNQNPFLEENQSTLCQQDKIQFQNLK